MTDISTVESEARHVAGSVMSALATRKAHPSYGYTKVGMRLDVERLVGIGQALAILADEGTTENAGIAYLKKHLDVDVRDLHARIDAAK